MPILPDNRMEMFCGFVSEGYRKGEAARLAGYSPKTAPQQASALLKRPEVVSRIDELRGITNVKAAEKVALSKAWVLAELMDRAKRYQDTNPTASVRALELCGKSMALFADVQVNTTDPLSELSEAEKLERAREAARMLGIAFAEGFEQPKTVDATFTEVKPLQGGE